MSIGYVVAMVKGSIRFNTRMGIIRNKVKLPKIMFRYVNIIKCVDTIYGCKNTKCLTQKLIDFSSEILNISHLET